MTMVEIRADPRSDLLPDKQPRSFVKQGFDIGDVKSADPPPTDKTLPPIHITTEYKELQ